MLQGMWKGLSAIHFFVINISCINQYVEKMV